MLQSDRINIAKCGRCRAVIVDDILISDILAMHNGVRDEIAQGMIEGAHGLLPPAASSESIPDLVTIFLILLAYSISDCDDEFCLVC